MVERCMSSAKTVAVGARSEEHTSELQSQSNLVCRLLLEKKNKSLTIHAGEDTTDQKNRVAKKRHLDLEIVTFYKDANTLQRPDTPARSNQTTQLPLGGVD